MYPVEYYVLATAVSPYSQLLGFGSIRISSSSGKSCSVPVRRKFVKWQNEPCLEENASIIEKWYWMLTGLSHLISLQASKVLFTLLIRSWTLFHSFISRSPSRSSTGLSWVCSPSRCLLCERIAQRRELWDWSHWEPWWESRQAQSQKSPLEQI